jgi:hypothetical protein
MKFENVVELWHETDRVGAGRFEVGLGVEFWPD